MSRRPNGARSRWRPVVGVVVALAGLGLTGCQVVIPGFDGTVPPTQGSWTGTFVFRENGGIPIGGGGQRLATVVTTYEASDKGGLPATWVTQRIDVVETTPKPAALPPGDCWISRFEIHGTINGWSTGNAYLSGGGIAFNGGNAKAQSGPAPMGKTTVSGAAACAHIEYGLGTYETAATETGPWTYNGPGGHVTPGGLYSGGGPSSSGRWLTTGMTTASWDIGIV